MEMQRNEDVKMMVTLIQKVIAKEKLSEADLDWINGVGVKQQSRLDGKYLLIVIQPMVDRRIFGEILSALSWDGETGVLIMSEGD